MTTLYKYYTETQLRKMNTDQKLELNNAVNLLDNIASAYAEAHAKGDELFAGQLWEQYEKQRNIVKSFKK